MRVLDNSKCIGLLLGIGSQAGHVCPHSSLSVVEPDSSLPARATSYLSNLWMRELSQQARTILPSLETAVCLICTPTRLPAALTLEAQKKQHFYIACKCRHMCEACARQLWEPYCDVLLGGSQLCFGPTGMLTGSKEVKNKDLAGHVPAGHQRALRIQTEPNKPDSCILEVKFLQKMYS